MDRNIFSVFGAILLVWIHLYGFCVIVTDILFSALPISLIAVVILKSLIYAFRIPPPSKEAVEAILGKDPSQVDLSECNDFVLRTVAHRGAGLDAPENSIAAFQMCSDKGCKGIEFDVSLTADDVPIIFHDKTLERMTNMKNKIKSMKWSEFRNVNIAEKHPLINKYKTTKIPKLDDAIKHCVNSKQIMFIDIKISDPKIVNIILKLYEKHNNLESKAICSSFYPHIIYKIRRRNPKIVCSLAWRPYFFSYESYSMSTGPATRRTRFWPYHFLLTCFDSVYAWLFNKIIYFFLGLSVVLIHKDAISGQVIQQWRGKNIRTMAWTVNHPVEKQHFSRNLKITYLTDTLIGESTAHLNTNCATASQNSSIITTKSLVTIKSDTQTIKT